VRVLILHSRYLSGDASGENRVALDEERLLRDAGHEVVSCSPAPEAGTPIDRARLAATAVWSRSAQGEVASMIRANRIEVVHVHNLFPTLSPSVLRTARRMGTAVVVTLHNFRLMCLPATFLRNERVCEDCLGHLPLAGVVHRCYRGSTLGSGVLATSLSIHRGIGTFGRVSRYLAVSEFVRRKHVDAGMDPARIGVKANFSWPVTPREGPGAYFLSLGRLSHEKGIDTLLRAWNLGDPPGRLVVVGDGPAGPELRGSAPPGVEFLGQLPADEIPAVLRGARALLIPSRWYEASPRAIVEAYAAGIPVVASDIGALPESIEEGRTGYLAPVDDAAAWAAVARRLLDDDVSLRLGREARSRWRERHSPERALLDLQDAYEAALAVG
jgi:glycosyltransferase involved in cell wall biosynthesis